MISKNYLRFIIFVVFSITLILNEHRTQPLLRQKYLSKITRWTSILPFKYRARLNINLLTFSISISTVSIIGIIIAVVAVFEIHMEMNIVTKKIPKVNLEIKKNPYTDQTILKYI